MKKKIALFILKCCGWKLIMNVPKSQYHKSVMIAAPHTSNWDLFFGNLVFWSMEVPVKFFIKDSHTKAFYGFFIKWLGGVGVNRSKNNRLIEYACKEFATHDSLVFSVPAEATRNRVEEWNKGFYLIARRAQLPVLLAFLDYKKKETGLGKIINLSGNFEEDMTIIEDFYKSKNPKYPALYNPIIFKRKTNQT